MIVEKNTVVDMNYTLKNDNGDVIDTSVGKGAMPVLHGHGNIVPGLEKAIEGMKIGESKNISVQPEEGYGSYHEEGVQKVPKEALQGIENLAVGIELQSQDEQGNPFVVAVKEINDDTVTVDANHPLAGQVLHFEISIENIRAASKEELEHGHVHTGACSH